jgi:hypothetical protein
MNLRRRKLVAGQNLRYVGKAFPGFVTGQRYMTFLSYHTNLEIVVKYNDTEITIFEYLTETIE